MNYEQNMHLFIKMFGYILPKDKNFNHSRLFEGFNTYFIKPLIGRSLHLSTIRDVDNIYNKSKKILKFVSCTIEHDEFHKIYNCTLSFKKYNTVYQKVDLSLRYDQSSIIKVYYHKNMRKYIKTGEQINLAYTFMKSRDYCKVYLEYYNNSSPADQPDSTCFEINNVIYDYVTQQNFNNSSLIKFNFYDANLNIKKIDYFCLGNYNFGISFIDGQYIDTKRNFYNEENISCKLAHYLNSSGLSLLELTDDDFLMCDAYAY